MPDTRARCPRNDAPIAPSREAEWLWLWRFGDSIARIAAAEGVVRSRVERGVEAALRREGSTDEATPTPTFGLTLSWGGSAKAKPTCEDVHPGGPIAEGSRRCCWHCHQSGMDGHPSLRLRPADVVGTPPDDDGSEACESD